jgi:hypothetical protein
LYSHPNFSLNVFGAEMFIAALTGEVQILTAGGAYSILLCSHRVNNMTGMEQSYAKTCECVANRRRCPQTSVYGQRKPHRPDHAFSTVCRGKQRWVFGQSREALGFTTASMSVIAIFQQLRRSATTAHRYVTSVTDMTRPLLSH